MKRWWIIYDKFSQSVEYYNIINFIKNTFEAKGILFNIVANNELTQKYLLDTQNMKMLPDVALFWCAGNLEQKKLLSKFGIETINGYKNSYICENKYFQLKILSKESELIPHTIFTDTKSMYEILNNNILTFPIVLKFSYSTLGSGVFIVNSVHEIDSIFSNLLLKSNENIMLQEYLTFSPQRVTKVCFYGDKILSCYNQYENDLSIHFTTNVEKVLILKTIKALGLNFGSIDIIYKSSLQPFICEVNNLPNILKIYRISNINIIEKIIDFYS